MQSQLQLQIQHYYYVFKALGHSFIAQYLPITQKLNRFENFLLLNILLFLICSILGFIADLQLSKNLSPKKISGRVMRFSVKHIPFVRNKFLKELQKLQQEVSKTFTADQRSVNKKIPKKPIDPSTIKNQSEVESLKGYISGSRYALKQHCDFVSGLAANFIYSNPLHFDIHPQVRQMEVQCIKMTAKMLNFTQNGEAVGAFTSGGTESIMLAILSYRQQGRARGITRPNLVVCLTAHVAALKGCDYFGIQPRFVKFDQNYCMSVSDMKKKIDSNTIGVYTSYPNFPYGTIDPIQQIGKYCFNKNIPVHIDMCLGGFLVPFLKRNGVAMQPQFPKGISTISVDPHKYGLCGKGASILLFSSKVLRKYQFFASSNWPGGLYGTVGFAGSRSGVAIASAWISMMRLGQKNYRQSAQRVQEAVFKLSKAAKQMGFKVYGNPQICVVAFSHPKYSVNALQHFLKKKWCFSLLQKPFAFHFSFTPLNSQRIDQMIKDLKDCLKQLQTTKLVFKDEGEIELYCACAKIPDGVLKSEIIGRLLDCYIDV